MLATAFNRNLEIVYLFLILVKDADSLLYLEDEISPKLDKQQKHLLAIIGDLICLSKLGSESVSFPLD